LPKDIQLNEATRPGITRTTAPRAVVGRLTAFALTVLLLAAGCIASEAQSTFATRTLVHQQAPEFVRTDLDRKRLDLKAYRGKVILLNFWATWCGPCQVEMPTFVAWQNKYGTHGLQVVGVSMDDDPAPVRVAYRKLKLNYPVAMGDVKLGNLYGGVLGLPITFLIDSDGEIRAEFQGETDLSKIEMQVKALLPGR
jgi:cytochrome c biogenesis protein CcmG/thiol:disulfide interchange protein DsbE